MQVFADIPPPSCYSDVVAKARKLLESTFGPHKYWGDIDSEGRYSGYVLVEPHITVDTGLEAMRRFNAWWSFWRELVVDDMVNFDVRFPDEPFVVLDVVHSPSPKAKITLSSGGRFTLRVPEKLEEPLTMERLVEFGRFVVREELESATMSKSSPATSVSRSMRGNIALSKHSPALYVQLDNGGGHHYEWYA